MIEEISDWNHTTDLSGSKEPRFDKKHVISDDFAVVYDDFMEGGGCEFAPYMIDIIHHINGRTSFRHALEWCSGPGFIGFTLLHENLCENIKFVDQYAPSLLAIQKTLEMSGDRYRERVSTAQTLDAVETSGIYDLIVANPPWYAHPLPGNSSVRNRIAVDLSWAAHKHFFSVLPHIMSDDGICIMLESIYGSSPVTFQDDLAAADLKIKSVLRCTETPHLYYLVIQHASLPRR
jgi:hypothetical protein